MAHDVFISYSKRDKTTADAVCATLEARGIRCWIAPRDILPGIDWGEAIIDAIQGSRVMVLIFSAHANQSSQIKREVERAVNKDVTVVPFRIEDVPMSKSLEYFVSTPHWMDAMSPPFEGHLTHLAETLGRLLARPEEPPVAAAPAPPPLLRPAPAPQYPPPQYPPPQQYAGPRYAPQPARPAGVVPQPWPQQQRPAWQAGPPPAYAPPMRGNGAAVASLWLGIFGCVPYLTSILAIFFAISGLKRSRDPLAGGRGMAVSGLILGICGVLGWGLVTLGWGVVYSEELTARPQVQQFLQDMSTGQLDAAFGQTNGLTRNQVQAMYDDHFRAWGPLKSVEWGLAVWDHRPLPGGSDTAAVTGDAAFQNGDHHVWVGMRKQDGKWKVIEFQVD